MKKYLTAILLLLSSCILSAQDLPLYGLSFGKNYTLDEICSAVGKQGERTAENILGIYVNCVSFSDMSFKGMDCNIYFMTFGDDNTLTGVGVNYSRNLIGSDIDLVYEATRSYLTRNCIAVSDEISGDDLTVQTFMDNTNNALVLLSRKGLDQISGLDVVYYDPSLMATMQDSTNEIDRPDVQNTFFGMKFGTRLTLSQIKIAVGTKGEFLQEERDGNNIEYTFENFVFGGKTWDYATFILNGKNTFMYFSVYDSMEDFSDERKDAQKLYDEFKEKLESKYGAGEEENEDNNYNVKFLGGNDVGLSLSNNRSRSNGGLYRRFVTLSYTDINVLRQSQAEDEDEL